MSSRPERGIVGAALALAAVLVPAPSLAAPPASDAASEPDPAAEAEPETASLDGRLIEAGGARTPVSGAAVLVIAAPDEVRPGRPARTPLDPAAVTWMVQTETDDEGRFHLAKVPVGKVRVVVVAGGYERLEQWAEVPRARALTIYLEPEIDGVYRTEVTSEREQLAEPDHELDGAVARRYAGSGDDPVLAALNLPGVARSPGGLGLLSLRGGNPSQTGVYLDGHPVPRAFHVIPIASVLSAPMTDRVELSPGNYGPNYGSFSGGMIHVRSRAGKREGVHGQAHVDLFDVGATAEGPVGPGAIHFGVRRSHVDGVIRGVEGIIGPTGILYPTYWDYLARLDVPVAPGHSLGVRALGAGDRLRSSPQLFADDGGGFDFRSSFHRFDLDYRVDAGPWRVLVSPSLRLDTALLDQGALLRRDAQVFSGRIEIEREVHRHFALHFGTDLVSTWWRRTRRRVPSPMFGGVNELGETSEPVTEQSRGDQLRLGAWIAARIHGQNWSLTPSLRVNLFHYGDETHGRLDPRIEARGAVHPKISLFAKLGMYSVPVVLTQLNERANLFDYDGTVFGGIADVPPYLITYFDPNVGGEVRDGATTATYAIQASTGVEFELPWELRGRVTGFWREVLPATIDVPLPSGWVEYHSPRQRSLGLELLLRRELGPIDGWIGYTLLSARRELDRIGWLPMQFDQRHNLVVLLSAALPRGFRIGARFRLVSGNPLATILGAEQSMGLYYPIRAEFGHSYQPLFHQLDIRVDKRWPLRRIAVSAYLDVQNVYDRRYPEVSVYTTDYSERASLIGLPIYPSFGVQIDY